jgi:hypothetical protein
MRFTTLLLLCDTHTNAPQLRILRFAANVSEVPMETYPQITLSFFSVFRDVQSHWRYLRYCVGKDATFLKCYIMSTGKYLSTLNRIIEPPDSMSSSKADRHWRWRQNNPPKLQWLFTSQHGVSSQETSTFVNCSKNLKSHNSICW